MAQMKQLGIDEAKLAYDDVANARAREIAVRDKLPAILAISVTVGFFAVLLIMLFRGVPVTGSEAFPRNARLIGNRLGRCNGLLLSVARADPPARLML